MITASINVTKVQKEKLIKGKSGMYLNLVLIETPNGQYGDFMVVQDTTKEERLQGVKGVILGNAKIFQKGGAQAKAAPKNSNPEPEDGSDVPF